MTGSGEGYDYGRARVAAGLILIILAAVLMVIDALSPDYEIDSVQLGLILGTGSVLLGVEAIRRVVNG